MTAFFRDRTHRALAAAAALERGASVSTQDRAQFPHLHVPFALTTSEAVPS